MAFDVSAACVGFWKLDENTTTCLISDALPTSIDGWLLDKGNVSVSTNRATSAGKLGNCLQFDGSAVSGRHVGFGNVLTFSRSAPFTMEAWIRQDDQDAATSVLEKAIATKMKGVGVIFQVENGCIALYIGNVATAMLGMYTSSNLVNDGTWHHVVATYAGTGLATGVHIFIDAVDRVLTNWSSTAISAFTIVSCYFAIGASKNQSLQGRFFIGEIDNVRVYNIALNEDQIKGLYNGGHGNLNLNGNFTDVRVTEL